MIPLLELKNISLSYHTLEGETPALSDISFSNVRKSKRIGDDVNIAPLESLHQFQRIAAQLDTQTGTDMLGEMRGQEVLITQYLTVVIVVSIRSADRSDDQFSCLLYLVEVIS